MCLLIFYADVSGFLDYDTAGLPNAFRLYYASYAACGIYIGMRSDDRSGIEHAVAADFNEIAEHSTYLLDASLKLFTAGLDNYVGLVRLDIRCYRTCTHMRFIAEYTVTDIIVMRSLHSVEKYDVFKLY